MNKNMLTHIIKTKIPKTSKVFVESEDNIHFDVVIHSSIFNEISSKVKQQRIVLNVLKEYIESGEIHAISMKTYPTNLNKNN